MNPLSRLRWQLFQDEVSERWQNMRQHLIRLLPKRSNKVGVALGEVNQDAEGRVWVEVGGNSLRLRVTHLHPANPIIAEEVILRKNSSHPCNTEISPVLTGVSVIAPTEDEISLWSLEDYWFNHWQGPYITADNNQNTFGLQRQRISYRRSKRKTRCSICQKKLMNCENGINDGGEGGDHLEREEAPPHGPHLPSLRSLHRLPKEDGEERGAEEESSNKHTTEEALSRYSASDEQLSRANRVLDNELRTSFSLFAEDTISTDVVDGSVCMDFLSLPPDSPRQSRSLPCSPKLAARTSSPESSTNSPKIRPYVGISKFSLSSSLLAIHRQASNSLKTPEFLKSDLGKPDSAGNSKNNSQQNSLKSINRKVFHSLSDTTHVKSAADDSLANATDDEIDAANSAAGSKNPVQESQSLPTLKLSKMSLTYRSTDDDSPVEPSANAVPYSPEKPENPLDGIPENSEMILKPKLLPDVVPNSELLSSIAAPHPPHILIPPPPSFTPSFDSQISPTPLQPQNPSIPNTQSGFINLGFDGQGESSDFTEINQTQSDPSASNKQPNQLANETTDYQQHNATVNSASDYNNDFEAMDKLSAQQYLANVIASEISEDGEVCDDVCASGGPSLVPDGPVLIVSEAPQLITPQVLPPIPLLTDAMCEARQLLYWWHKEDAPAGTEDDEFCRHQAHCKVKQRPLLLFLHSIGSSSDVWTQQLWYFLTCGYEVVAPDLLGHGLSSAPSSSGKYSFCNMLDYISLVFDLFVPHGRKCVVVAHGYGCALAAALARGRPLSVSLLVLASCGGPVPLTADPCIKSKFSTIYDAVLRRCIDCGCLSRELLYVPRGKHFCVASSSAYDVPSTPPYVLQHTAKGQHWPEGDLAFHRRITVPTLLLHGISDTKVSLVEMCEMEKTISRASLEVISSAGHEVMTDNPQEVCHSIHKFIKRWNKQI